MKKHLRLILLSIISMIVPLGLSAQEDVTAVYLVNPGFELGPSFFHDPSQVISGWNISKENLSDAFLNQNDGTTPPEGLNVFGVWSPGSIADMEIAQTVKNLPAGTYSISCLLTVPDGGYSTQRLFAYSNSVGTKSMYFGATSLAVVPGESYDYADYAIDGNGNGPYHPMSITIKVAAGDSLVFGIRSNGKLSTVCAFSALDGHGLFKVDDFKLSYISDENALVKSQIQDKITVISAFPKDSIPGGYTALIDAKVIEATNKIATQTNIDSLNAYLLNIKSFITTLGTAKTSFINLMNLFITAENVTNTTNMSGKQALLDVIDDVTLIFNSFTSLTPDFNKAYSDLNTAYHLYIDGRLVTNLALLGTPTTSYVSPWESLKAVNDGFEPTSSADRAHPVYGNWNGNSGQTDWVQYEWPYYHTIQSVSVYWFSDGGGLAQPTTAIIEYWQNNAWVSAGAIDTVLNQYNTLAINNVKTNKIRVSMSSPTTTGIIEFKVMGLQKTVNDIDDYKRMVTDGLSLLNSRNQAALPQGYTTPIATIKTQGATELSTGTLASLTTFNTQLTDFNHLIDSAAVVFDDLTYWKDSTTLLLNSTNFVNKDKLQAAYNAASVIYVGSTSMIADFLNEIPVLKNAIDAYTSGKVLVSLSRLTNVVVTTSHVSSWEKLAAVNDGFDPTSSTDNTHGKYGNWTGTDATANWIQYEWPVAESVKSVSVYWFTDGGGLAFPDSTGVDYWDGTAWQTVGPIGSLADQYNSLNVDFTTTKLRLYMRSVTAVGVIELQVKGYAALVGLAPVKNNNNVNVYPTMVKRGSMMTIDFANEQAKPVAVELFTISGQRVYKTAVSGKTSSVNVPSSLSSGIYMMVLNTTEGRMYKKIVVE